MNLLSDYNTCTMLPPLKHNTTFEGIKLDLPSRQSIIDTGDHTLVDLHERMTHLCQEAENMHNLFEEEKKLYCNLYEHNLSMNSRIKVTLEELQHKQTTMLQGLSARLEEGLSILITRSHEARERYPLQELPTPSSQRWIPSIPTKHYVSLPNEVESNNFSLTNDHSNEIQDQEMNFEYHNNHLQTYNPVANEEYDLSDISQLNFDSYKTIFDPKDIINNNKEEEDIEIAETNSNPMDMKVAICESLCFDYLEKHIMPCYPLCLPVPIIGWIKNSKQVIRLWLTYINIDHIDANKNSWEVQKRSLHHQKHNIVKQESCSLQSVWDKWLIQLNGETNTFPIEKYKNALLFFRIDYSIDIEHTYMYQNNSSLEQIKHWYRRMKNTPHRFPKMPVLTI